MEFLCGVTLAEKIPENAPNKNRRRHTVVGIGEMLWDLLPGARHAGGAPLNFAYICWLLGEHAFVATRTGSDDLGTELIREMCRRELDVSCVQRDAFLPTGTAAVELSPDGQPTFEIRKPAAWDAFEWTAEWEHLALQADAICFGTLAQRSAKSRATIRAFLQNRRPDCAVIFDANLRSPFYSPEVILNSLKMATIAKWNEAEFAEIAPMAGPTSGATAANLQALARNFHLDLVCLTRGSRGSLLVTPTEAFDHEGFPVEIRDTIGAGDAFAAAVAHGWLAKASLERTSEIANRCAAWVASQAGAMPLLDAASLDQLPSAASPW